MTNVIYTNSWHQKFKTSPKASRTDEHGTVFASKAELKRWQTLLHYEKLGLIKNLKRQVHHPLISSNGVAIKTPTGRIAKYTSDFEYESKEGHIIEDCKGYSDRLSAFRIAVFEALSGKKVMIVK